MGVEQRLEFDRVHELDPIKLDLLYSTFQMPSLRERLDDDKYKSVQIDIVFGDAGHEIANLAERRGAELIVLPSHGRTGIKRLLIGSVAERVVRLAHCPVLVLRS